MRVSKIDLFINLIIAVSTTAAVAYYFIPNIKPSADASWGCFKYFTTDSNVLMALASFVWLRYALWGKAFPKWVVLLKFSGTVAVTLTFLTVIFFLSPMRAAERGGLAYFDHFKGNVLILHLTTPLLAVISWMVLEKGVRLSGMELLWGVLPTLAYGIVYAVMVVKLARWKDFYGFTFGGKTALVFPVFSLMLLVSFGISSGLNHFSN